MTTMPFFPAACDRMRPCENWRSLGRRSRIFPSPPKSRQPDIPWKQIAGMRDKVRVSPGMERIAMMWPLAVELSAIGPPAGEDSPRSAWPVRRRALGDPAVD